MTPFLSKSQAHLLFGTLYRKPRSEGVQRQVNEVVHNTSDIFVRIHDIEKLDKQEEKKNQKSYQDIHHFSLLSNEERKRKESGNPTNPSSSSIPKNKAPPGLKQEREKSFYVHLLLKSFSFCMRFFKPSLNLTDLWNEQTGVMKKDFLGRNYQITPKAQKTFSGIQEDVIIPTIQGFRAAINHLWEFTEILEYNTFVNAYQFFMEYIKLERLFQRYDKPQEWCQETIRMQKYYAQLIRHPGYSDVLLKTFPQFLESTPQYQHLKVPVKKAMTYIIELNQQSPKLSHVIQGFYIINYKKFMTWKEIEKILQTKNHEMKSSYISKKIRFMSILKRNLLLRQYHSFNKKMDEAKIVREQYLSKEKREEFQEKHLLPLLQEFLQKIYKTKDISTDIIETHMSQAPRLLFAIMKDFNFNYLPLFQFPSMIRSLHNKEMKSRKVFIFNQQLFESQIMGFRDLFRTIEIYNKKNPKLTYMLSEFEDDLEKSKIHPLTPHIAEFHQLIQEAHNLFQNFILNINKTIKNHQDQKHPPENNIFVQPNLNGKLNEEIDKNSLREHPAPSYVSWTQNMILSPSRYNEQSVQQVVEILLYHIYNYLYIFQNKEIMYLVRNSETQETLTRLKQEITRLGRAINESADE